MYIAIPHGDLIKAMRENGVSQSRLNDLEDDYVMKMCDGSNDRTNIYTSDDDVAELEPEVGAVVKQWIEAGYVPKGEKYTKFILYFDR